MGHPPAVAGDSGGRSSALSATTLDSIGVDTWGCDYALVGEDGSLLQNPYHYRDNRTDGVMEAVFAAPAGGRDLCASPASSSCRSIRSFSSTPHAHATPKLIEAARALVTIPDLLNYWLTGELTAEFTNATTTQFVDARTRSWATRPLVASSTCRRAYSRTLIEPGTGVGPLRADVSPALAGTPVVAPACHDTGSAVAAVNAGGARAFLSSGTWSLLGTEVPEPIITPRSRELNFTNEGGVFGTTRLLKNIAGMWLLQGCRRNWAATGQRFEYDELLGAASDDRHAFQVLFDPDHGTFLHPTNMVSAIADYCHETGQAEPDGAPAFTRARSWKVSRSSTASCSSRIEGADRHAHYRGRRLSAADRAIAC